MNPHFTADILPYELEIEISAERDELWSYVGNKKNQRWIWYANERIGGMLIAWHNGRRTDESCRFLMDKMSAFYVARYYTDDWKSYSRYIHFSKHVIRKPGTWRIERLNLNF